MAPPKRRRKACLPLGVEFDDNGYPHGVVTSQRAVADVLGVSNQSIKRWVTLGMPRLPNGKYALYPIQCWREANVDNPSVAADRSSASNAESLERKRAAEARIAEEKASKLARENAIATADIVHRHDVERFFAAVFSTFRDQLQQIPEQLKPTYPAKQREDMAKHLKDRLDLALRTIHNMRDKISEIES